ncbi:hypothetical protein [Kitasatospora sp. NPDC001527]|uniref:hypothetical protein n=1 Tax=Kitasatospora sp. NPDC001527 TaxID=3154519 RepID=UPI003317D3DB
MTTTESKWGGTKAALQRAEDQRQADAPAQDPAAVAQALRSALPAPGSPDHITATADQEVTEAEQLLAALEDRVRDGDDTVTAEQVEEARGLRRFAQLRREAAQRKAEKARLAEIDADAARRRDAFLAEITPHDLTKLPALQKQAEDALFELLELCGRYGATVHKHMNRLLYANEGRTALAIKGNRAGLIVIDGTEYHAIDGAQVADKVLKSALQRHFEALEVRRPGIEAEDAAYRDAAAASLAEADAKLYGTPAWEELPARRRAPAEALLAERGKR